ncbi:MAG: DnaJ domain-containing protein [Bryobacteraceae bacterium]|nr:DnaJ domain-containing protein [Bryobacteraceae bacterium]MDW8376721.1 DnaJ domain-containing protein [Bryobacterales bacterium]
MMSREQASATDFVDYYELLQISPNAEAETIQRVFRMLAQRYHPDNKETGNEPIFQQLLKAYHVLSDPARRAAYDVQHRSQTRLTWQIFDQTTASSGRGHEQRKRQGILGLLYQKRQHSPTQPGLNVREMEDLLNTPKEHLEFALWYLKESGDIKVADNGRYVITVKGVDVYEQLSAPPPADLPETHLLPPGSPRKAQPQPAEPAGSPQ